MSEQYRVCARCGAIITWCGTPERGQWRHGRVGREGRLYITTHAPDPAPQYEPEGN